jgi:hypothetical protein
VAVDRFSSGHRAGAWNRTRNSGYANSRKPATNILKELQKISFFDVAMLLAFGAGGVLG